MIKYILIILTISITSIYNAQISKVVDQDNISKIKKKNLLLKEHNLKLKEKIGLGIQKNKKLKKEKGKLSKKIRTWKHATLSERYIDSKILEIVPKNILDSLKLNFPSYFIPTKNMYAGGSPYLKDSLAHPFFIQGDFNNDKIEDYAFLLKTIYPLNYKYWGNKQLMIFFYSKKLRGNNKQVYQIVEQKYGEGVGFHVVSELAFVKLEASAEYTFRGGMSHTSDHDNIMAVSWGNDVGYIVDYIGGEIKYHYLWDFL